MVHRLFAWGLALLALGLVWRAWQLDWLVLPAFGSPPPPPTITFDNGSVRTPTVAVRPAPGIAPGPLAKCVRGSSVVYTHFSCPAGHRPTAMNGGTLNLMQGEPSAPKASAHGSLSPDGAKARLHANLGDPAISPALRERHIERVVHGE